MLSKGKLELEIRLELYYFVISNYKPETDNKPACQSSDYWKMKQLKRMKCFQK